MSTSSLLTLLLGAVLATLGGMVTELWRQRRDRRVAARLVYLELLRNYGAIVSFRVGDADRNVLDQLSSTTWKEQSSKFALLQSYTDFQRLWGLYQMFPILNSSDNSQLAPAAIDAVLDTLDDALIEVGSLAGISSSSLEEMKEANRRIRGTIGLSKEQRIQAWQTFYTDSSHQQGKRLAGSQGFSISESGDVVLALQHTLALSISEGTIQLTLPSPTYSSLSLSTGKFEAHQPLIRAGQPLIMPISEKDIDDPSIKRLLGEHSRSALSLVLIGFSYSFLSDSKLRYVDITIDLQNKKASALAAPIAFSMDPTTLDSNVASTNRVALSVAGNELQLGRTRTDADAGRFLIAAGLGTSRPSWHLRSTPSAEIVGAMRFLLIVEAAKGASVKATVAVHASQKKRFGLLRYQSQFQSQPTTFEFSS